ncbi:MAG: pentapeptide repeat-containing protein [Phascolarctobacterium sp.]|nr:pentapeptide repeat-containing protein [Phascolarctobacterium sp.]
MCENNIEKMKKHQQWLESEGFEGTRLELDEVDCRELAEKFADFSHTFLTSCLFNEIVLESKDFYSAELFSTSFLKSKIKDCNFTKCVLDYANFDSSIIQKSDFSRADMNETSFAHSVLIKCSFNNSGLWITDFTDATLDNVDFSKAYFEETILKGTKIINPINLDNSTVVSVNIGDKKKPNVLKGLAALEWIKSRVISL